MVTSEEKVQKLEEGLGFVDVVQATLPKTVSIETERGLGSGFVIVENGQRYIITNHHVIEGAKTFVAKMYDGTRHALKLLGSHPTTDIAILATENSQALNNIEPLEWSTTPVKPGQGIIAIGNPLGLDHTVTDGIISAYRGWGTATENDDWIQHTALINPGNSGGLLFSVERLTSGERVAKIVGVNVAITLLELSDPNESRGFFSKGGTDLSSSGIAWAVPTNVARNTTRNILAVQTLQQSLNTPVSLLNDDERMVMGIEEKYAFALDGQKLVIGFKSEDGIITLKEKEQFDLLAEEVKRNCTTEFVTLENEVVCFRQDQQLQLKKTRAREISHSFWRKINHPVYFKYFKENPYVTHVNFKPLENFNSLSNYLEQFKDQEKVIVHFEKNNQRYFTTVPTKVLLNQA